MSHPRRAQTNIWAYEHLVIGKHSLQGIYCHIPSVYKLYMERRTNNSWKETENHEGNEFLELEMQIWKEMFPYQMEDLDCEGGQNEENENDDEA